MKSYVYLVLLCGLHSVRHVRSGPSFSRETDGEPFTGINGIADVDVEYVTGPYGLSEGPHWDADARVLYFVDIPEQKLHCYDPATNRTTFAYIKNGPLGAAVPIVNYKDFFIAVAGNDFIEIQWDRKENDEDPHVGKIAATPYDTANTRFNDGKVDPQGRFWAGTMYVEEEPNIGALYRLEPATGVTRVLKGVTISNGLVWSPDNTTFYYIDSPTRKVLAYEYNVETGDIRNPKVLYDFETHGLPGVPDGMTIDEEGNLWIAVYNGGRVISIDSKTGELLTTVMMPVMQVTSVAFGGPDLDVLYVTSGRERLEPEDLEKQPKAGSVFAVRGLSVAGSSAGRGFIV